MSDESVRIHFLTPGETRPHENLVLERSEIQATSTTTEEPSLSEDVHKSHISDFGSDDALITVLGILAILAPFGMALFQAGLSKRQNTVAVLLKPILQICLGCISFWLVGYGLAFSPGNQFMGLESFAFNELPRKVFSKWFFQCALSIFCVSIASSSGLERNLISTEIILASLIPSFLYAVPVHWTWTPKGWLNQQGFVDHAGAGVISMVGGGCALVLCILSGPRIGRFSDTQMHIGRFGHNLPFASLGAFLTVLGQIAIHLGAGGCHVTDPLDDEHDHQLSRVFLNAILSMSGAGLVTVFVAKMKRGKWSIYKGYGGIMAGLVACSPSTDSLYAWAAFIIGVLAAVLYLLSRGLILRLEIDDPLDCVSIHVTSGFFGLVITPILRLKDGIIFSGGSKLACWGLAWNIAGAAALLLWSTLISLLLFGTLSKLKLLTFKEKFQGELGIDQFMREVAYESSSAFASLKHPRTTPLMIRRIQDPAMRTPRVVIRDPMSQTCPAPLTPARSLPEYLTLRPSPCPNMQPSSKQQNKRGLAKTCAFLPNNKPDK